MNQRWFETSSDSCNWQRNGDRRLLQTGPIAIHCLWVNFTTLLYKCAQVRLIWANCEECFATRPGNIQMDNVLYRHIFFWKAQIEFFTNIPNWQKCQHWHRRLYYVKKSSNKMLPHWALNSLPQPFRSNTLLSKPLRQLLLGISLNCLLILHHLNRAWPYMRSQLCQVAVASISERGEHKT